MQLNFKKFGDGFPLIILHGLLGSLDNWQSIAKKLAETLPLSVYIVDQRNHGRSPHTDEFDYELLVKDLLEFMAQQGLKKAHLLGHSMGGKVVMQFALEQPEKVEKLVVVDMATDETTDHQSYVFDALNSADVETAVTRKEVEEVLRYKLGDNETLVQFLMKGLTRNETDQHFEWKFNLKSLGNHLEDIEAPIESANTFNGATLFIAGGNSDYVNASNYPDMTRLFPNNQLVEIAGAGHWVHADKPVEFVKAVLEFISGT
jgi:esterase